MPVGHLYVFFGKMSIQVFCPFFNRVVCLLVLSCMSSLYIDILDRMWFLLMCKTRKLEKLGLEEGWLLNKTHIQPST